MALGITLPPTDTPCFSADPAERRELSALFTSTDPIDHREAARLCADCPFQRGCFDTAAAIAHGPTSWAKVPEGTWGGCLFVAGKLRTRRRTAAAS